MTKKNFITLILSTIGGILFAVGMCMCLLPEWNAFKPGVSAVDALYAKAVPGNVREFLDLRSGMEMKPAEKRKRPRPQAEPEPAPAPVPESSDSF